MRSDHKPPLRIEGYGEFIDELAATHRLRFRSFVRVPR
jgi:hypothetical protein